MALMPAREKTTPSLRVTLIKSIYLLGTTLLPVHVQTKVHDRRPCNPFFHLIQTSSKPVSEFISVLFFTKHQITHAAQLVNSHLFQSSRVVNLRWLPYAGKVIHIQFFIVITTKIFVEQGSNGIDLFDVVPDRTDSPWPSFEERAKSCCTFP